VTGHVLVSFDGASPGTFSLVLKDNTKRWTKTVSASLANAQLSSAEVITEAPCCTFNGGVLPLTNFGTANFSSVSVNGQAIGGFNPERMDMGGPLCYVRLLGTENSVARFDEREATRYVSSQSVADTGFKPVVDMSEHHIQIRF